MAEVQFKNVYKIYEKKTEIIKDFNLEIHNQEFLVLVGPSGCGKSTLLRMIAGLEEVSKGDLLIGGKRVNEVPPRDRNIAMVFQNYALYPHMSVRENMGFSLKLKGAPREEIESKVQQASQILGLDHLLERKPKQLSGGQRQRVAMGRAIVRSPEVFLFDEPLSNLDAKLRVQMRVEIARLHKRLQTTIVYVTHDQVEAMTLADRIVVLKDGLVQQVGSPMELYERPANAFVGGFIGSPSMNQVPAQVEEKEGKLCLCGKEFSIPLSPAQTQALKTLPEKKILLGIRPQDIFSGRHPSGDAEILAVVDVIEPMGGESFIYFTLEGKQWVSRCEGNAEVKEGEKTSFSFHPEKLHIFSEDGARRLV